MTTSGSTAGTELDAAGKSAPAAVPRTYWLWLVGVSLSVLGNQVMTFAMA